MAYVDAAHQPFIRRERAAGNTMSRKLPTNIADGKVVRADIAARNYELEG